MPLYDYQCDRCQATFEVRATFQEKERGLKPVCPNCKSVDTHQLISFGLLVHSGAGESSSGSSSCCGPNTGGGCCGG